MLTSAPSVGATKLLCITPFARGFLTSGTGGVLCIFEGPKDEKEAYQLSHTFVCSQTSATAVGTAAGGSGRERLDITALSATPSEEVLHVATASSQLCTFPLANIDILNANDHHFALYASGGFHHACARSARVCHCAPVLALWRASGSPTPPDSHPGDTPWGSRPPPRRAPVVYHRPVATCCPPPPAHRPLCPLHPPKTSVADATMCIRQAAQPLCLLPPFHLCAQGHLGH